MTLSLLFLFIRRQWRTHSLPLLAMAVMIAVASLSTVMLLSSRMQQAVAHQTSETLGADAVIKTISEIPKAWINKASDLHLQTSVAAIFPTMISYGDKLELAALKAVDAHYPLYPGLITDPPLVKDKIGASILSGKAWMDSILLEDLNAKIGDRVQIGNALFEIAGVIQSEPDKGWQFINFSPRVLISLTDLPATQLVQVGSNINYQFSIAGKMQAITEFMDWVKPQLTSGQQIISLSDTQPQLNAIIQRMQNYFSLVALFAVALAGIAIAVVARHYTQQQYDICALLRCLGASQKQYLYWQCAVLLMIGLAAAIIGAAIGYFTHFAVIKALSHWLNSLGQLPSVEIWRVLVSGMQGIIILLAFALPPLLKLRDISPMRLLRKDLAIVSINIYLTYLLAVMSLLAILIWQTQDFIFSIKIISILVAGVLILLPLLYLVIKTFIKIALKAKRTYLFVHLLSLRLQIGNASVQVIATTLVLTLLILLQGLRTHLIHEWQTQLPEQTPNQFLINVLPQQVEPISELLKSTHLIVPKFYPIVPGRLIANNGKPYLISEYPNNEAPNAIRRALQLTWMSDLPQDNKITTGAWMMTENAPASISIDKAVAEQLNVHLNDQLTFKIGEKEITGLVTSMREIEWGSFQPNFFVIFNPGVLNAFPHTFIASFYLPISNIELRQSLHTQFSNVTIIDIAAVIKNAQSLLASATHAIEITLLFSLAAAIIVLIAIFYTGFQQRYLTNAILRSVGANARQLIAAILIEYGFLAILSAGIAILLINGIWWWLAKFIFHFTYYFQWQSSFYILVASLVIYGFMGIIGGLRLIKPNVQRLLSAESG